MNRYPCSGCGSRHCDGRCFLESAADYPEADTKAVRIYERLAASAEAREHQRINDTLAPVAHVKPWEVAVMTLTAMFIGFILVAL